MVKWNVSFATDPTLTKIAAATGLTNAQVVLRWELQKGVVVNPRSQTPAHQAQDIAVAHPGATVLTPGHMDAIDAIHPLPRVPPIRKVCPDPATRK